MSTKSSISPSVKAPKGAVTGVSPFLRSQQELKQKLHCDYVLLWYKRDPESIPGQCPNFLCVGEPIPVKLSHHVFMQMAFGVLKDRLWKGATRKTNIRKGSTAGAPEKRQHGGNSTNSSESNTTATSGEQPSNNTTSFTSREQDAVAMYCFLWQFTTKMLKSQEEALALARKHKKTGGVEPSPSVRMTKQQLRLQLLLEYGVDVQKVLGDGLPTTGAVRDEYYKELLTGKVSEEEFLNQLSKPAGMAQTCGVM
ncbi:hypothetical protein DPX39_110126500 [Trypanosoma brucei equiperdum]|uniref:Uncharacterized protein n=1 Tax=Trypanosoma brucei equiperdum TaxID=630700 RepID=A0A3L6KVQ6_9TRYP|nr:hypothetical protein DPX39_110126500 [Trypanosoma brucei equiperdum]